MLTSIDVANFFIYLNKKEFELSLTNRMLNHLVYLAFGWYYAKNDEMLFNDKIIAKQNYILIKNVDNTFNHYNNNIIDEYHNQFDISKFCSKEIELLIAVYDYYSIFSSNHIRKILCHKQTPWYLSISQNNQNIDVNQIYSFFKKRKYFDDIH